MVFRPTRTRLQARTPPTPETPKPLDTDPGPRHTATTPLNSKDTQAFTISPKRMHLWGKHVCHIQPAALASCFQAPPCTPSQPPTPHATFLVLRPFHPTATPTSPTIPPFLCQILPGAIFVSAEVCVPSPCVPSLPSLYPCRRAPRSPTSRPLLHHVLPLHKSCPPTPSRFKAPPLTVSPSRSQHQPPPHPYNHHGPIRRSR